VTLMEMVAPALTGVADIPGNPAALRATALTYTAVADTVEAAANHQVAALDTVPSGWSGMAALAYKAMAAARLARARNAGGAFREAAGALSVYANDLETAQGLAREARATATIVRDDAARLDAESPTSEFLAPGPGDRPGDVWGQELLAYARDASSRSAAAAEQARAAAVRAAAAFDRLAALAPAPAAPGAAAGGSQPGAGQPADPDGSWWQGALRQLGSFLDGGRDAIVDPFVDAYRLTPLADGWQDQWKQISAGMEHLAIHPDELPGALLGLDDLRENGVAHWLGGLAPDAAAMVLSGGVSLAVRARKAPEAAQAAARLGRLGNLGDVDLAEETERVIDLSDLATTGRHGASDAPSTAAPATDDPARSAPPDAFDPPDGLPDDGLSPLAGTARDFPNREEGALWGKQEYDPLARALPSDEHYAVRRYTGGDSVDLNKFLAGVDPDLLPSRKLYEEYAQDVALIDQALARKPLPEDVVAYHRTSESAIGGDDLLGAIGKEQTIPGYWSTSLGGPLEDSRLVVMRLQVPAGTPAMYVGSISYVPEEAELLLGRGLRYQITGVHQLPDGTSLVDATILPSAP
jgi:hypothetical protein